MPARFFFAVTLIAALRLGGLSAAEYDDEIPVMEAPLLEFVVTPSRSSESPDSVPAHIEVISAGDIEKSGASSVAELFESLPYIQVRMSMAGSGSGEISMRGFGENSGTRVLVLVDGHKRNDPDMHILNWLSIPLYDIERIEIYDGPASVQYGSNAVGGVINIITKKAPRTATILGVSGASFFGNSQFFSHQRSFSGAALSVSAGHTGSGGYRDRQGFSNAAMSGRMNFFLSDAVTLEADASFVVIDYAMPGSLSKAQFESDPRQAANQDDDAKEQHLSGGLALSWELSPDLTLVIPGRYSLKKVESNFPSYYTPNYTNRTVHSGELRPRAAWSKETGPLRFSLSGGVDLDMARLDVRSYADKARDTPAATLGGGAEVRAYTAAPYLTGRFSPCEYLTLSLGARYDSYFLFAETRDGTLDDAIVHHAFVYAAGLTVNPSKDLKFYASFTRLFHYPAADEQAEVYYGGTFNSGLKPETGFNAEAGTSYRLNRLASGSARFFFMRVDDEIWYNPLSYANENMDGNTGRFGLNADLELTPFAWAAFRGGYSLMRAIFRGGAFREKTVPLVPAHSVYAGMSLLTSFGLEGGADWTYASAAYQGGDFTNTRDRTGATNVFGLFVHYTLKKDGSTFAARLAVDNLLDASYAPLVYWDGYYPAAGRTISASLTYTF
ncbi:MAG: TonB-dependent receptor [Spirochaetaceae bacterium]|nr:TonB-dependent receptor [Spirochaetaceae bacterium]